MAPATTPCSVAPESASSLVVGGNDTLNGGPGIDQNIGGPGQNRCLDTVSECQDLSAPVLGSFSIDQSSVDTSQASQTITGTARVTDDMSGVAQAVVAMCNGQNEVWFSSTPGNLISGDVWDGIYQVSAVLSSYTPLRDLAGLPCGYNRRGIQDGYPRR